MKYEAYYQLIDSGTVRVSIRIKDEGQPHLPSEMCHTPYLRDIIEVTRIHFWPNTT